MRPLESLSPATAAVLRSLNLAHLPLAGCRSRDWQSLIFIGEQMDFTFKLPDEAATQEAARLLAKLDDLSLEAGGPILADIHGSIEGDTLKIEALTVEE